jgi:two-component system chemotaxis sensor kinase CheA
MMEAEDMLKKKDLTDTEKKRPIQQSSTSDASAITRIDPPTIDITLYAEREENEPTTGTNLNQPWMEESDTDEEMKELEEELEREIEEELEREIERELDRELDREIENQQINGTGATEA